MPADVITTQKDTHYSDEIDHLVLKMIDEVREIYHLWKIQPNQVSLKFVNEFIPDFVKLYDLTGDYLEIRHPSERNEDVNIRTSIKSLIYYLDGITGNNGHSEVTNKENIIRGINMFREYKKQLQKEGIVVVF
jgi:hypothetical protein